MNAKSLIHQNGERLSAEFLGASLSILCRDGQKWLTAEQAGRALGYSEANVRQGIINLYSRHCDEFSAADSREINLISRDGKPRETRIFSASGCILLSFFSNTPRAAKFRAWAKAALAGGVSGRLALTPEESPAALDRLSRALLAARPKWARAIRYRAMGLSQREIALLMRWNERTVSRTFHAMKAAGLSLPPTRIPPPRGTLPLSGLAHGNSRCAGDSAKALPPGAARGNSLEMNGCMPVGKSPCAAPKGGA
jgi:hypothetical protein